jgi:hypothetical protein
MPRLDISDHSPEAIRAQLRSKALGMQTNKDKDEEVTDGDAVIANSVSNGADEVHEGEVLPPQSGPTVIEGEYTADSPRVQHAYSHEEPEDQDPFEPENATSTNNIDALRQSRFRESSLEQQSSNRQKAMTPGPLRQFDSSTATTMGALFEQLTRNLPLNDFGLPDYIYRTDLIDIEAVKEAIDIIKLSAKGPQQAKPSNTIGGVVLKSAGSKLAGKLEEKHEEKKDELKAKTDLALKMLAAAQVRLDYHEGFPTLPDGMPMWGTLPAEPMEAYHAFTEYMELPGNRHVHLLTTYPLEDLLQWIHMYYWQFRCKSFDLFRVAHAQKLRQKRLLNSEDNHYVIADKMIKALQPALDGISEDDLMALAPAEKILLMEKAIKLQRLALGLPMNGGPTPEDARKVIPQHVLIQQINQPGVITTAKDGVDSYSALHDDPDMLEKAQELILHMNGADIGSHLPREQQKFPLFKDKVSKRSDGK